jgi:hypothetical protein
VLDLLGDDSFDAPTSRSGLSLAFRTPFQVVTTKPARENNANGSEEGAETQAVLMSVFRTLKQRGHNPVSAFLDAVRTHLQTGQLPPLPKPVTENG